MSFFSPLLRMPLKRWLLWTMRACMASAVVSAHALESEAGHAQNHADSSKAMTPPPQTQGLGYASPLQHYQRYSDTPVQSWPRANQAVQQTGHGGHP